MHDVLGVAVIDSLKELLHVARGLHLVESLVLLLRDPLEQRLTRDVLHHEVDVLEIVVGLVVLDDVGVVEGVQDGDLLHDAVNVVHELVLVQHFDGDLEVRVVLVVREEDATERASAQHLGFRVDLIVLSELGNTLLLASLADFDHLPLHWLNSLAAALAFVV